MRYLDLIKDKIQTVRAKFTQFIGWLGEAHREGEIPQVGEDTVGSWVNSLFEDAKAWRREYFNSTKDSRFGYADPIIWGRKLNEIESGNHWAAWGTRRVDPVRDAWMCELVDDEVTDQMRLRNAHIAGNWHDIQISPNINNIDDILRAERKKSRWGEFVLKLDKTARKYGDAWVRSFLDKTEYREGIANERVCAYGSIFISPFARGKLKSESCWYIIEARMETGQWVRENFPNFDLTTAGGGFTARSEISLDRSTSTYSHTREYSVLEVFLDDPAIEKVPFSRDEFELKLAQLLAGEVVKVDPWADNHKEYVKAYEEYLDSLLALAESLGETFAPQDEEDLELKVELIQAQIMQHVEIAYQNGYPEGMRPKYPFGRHIITIDNVVAFDQPNEYGFDWRALFHRLKNEDVPDRVDGRGDIETMWNTQKALDENLSRFADAALIAAMPKRQRHVSDKRLIEEQGGENNDPRETEYYVQQPPVYTKAPPPMELLEMYRIQKTNAKQKGADTNVARGNAPTGSASGDLVEILAAQNDVVMQGELATNMISVLEDVVETKLMIMRKFYTEPRCYLINGVQQYLIPSQVLSKTTVQDETGQEIEKDIDKFEVSVVPGSNSPNKWEREVRLISVLQRTLVYPDGTPAIPVEAVIDKIAEKYPQFGRNGKYANVNRATQIGMQVLAQQAQAATARASTLGKMDQAKEAVLRKVPRIADTIPGNVPLNGNGNNNENIEEI